MKNDNIRCRHHKITIHFAHSTFCSALEHHRGSGYFAMEDENLEPGMIYNWVEYAYKSPYAKGLPMYGHEFLPLAMAEAYAGWSEKEDQDTRRQLDKQVMDRLRAETDRIRRERGEPEPIPLITQISRRVRDLLSRFGNRRE